MNSLILFLYEFVITSVHGSKVDSPFPFHEMKDDIQNAGCFCNNQFHLWKKTKNKTKQNKHYQIFQKPQNIPRFTLLAWDFYFAFSRAVRAALFFFQIKHLAKHLHTSPLSQGWGVKCNLTHMGLATRYLYRRSIKICATMPSQLPHNHSNTHTHHRTTTDYRPLLQ